MHIPANVEQYRSINAQRVELLPPWFVKEKIYPRVLVEKIDRFCSDVVFIAHYEDDGRIDVVRDVVKAGVKLALYGPEWNRVIKDDPSFVNFGL